MYKYALQLIFYGLSSIILCAAFVAILEWIKKKLFNIGKKCMGEILKGME